MGILFCFPTKIIIYATILISCINYIYNRFSTLSHDIYRLPNGMRLKGKWELKILPQNSNTNI